jgi:hypothetical protein
MHCYEIKNINIHNILLINSSRTKPVSNIVSTNVASSSRFSLTNDMHKALPFSFSIYMTFGSFQPDGICFKLQCSMTVCSKYSTVHSWTKQGHIYANFSWSPTKLNANIQLFQILSTRRFKNLRNVKSTQEINKKKRLSTLRSIKFTLHYNYGIVSQLNPISCHGLLSVKRLNNCQTGK